MCSSIKIIIRFVKCDVTIVTDPQNLDVRPAELCHQSVIVRTGFLDILGKSIRDMCALYIDIDVV